MSRRLPALLALALAACADVTPEAPDVQAEGAPLTPAGLDLPLPTADGPLPVWQTDAERRRWKEDSFDVRGSYQDIFGFTPPPPGPVRSVAEFETTDAVLVAWDRDLSAFMVDVVRALAEASLVYVTTPSLSDTRAARDRLARGGVEVSRVRFFEFPHESFWTRDFGPIPALSASGAPAFIDPVYYPDRRRDDAIPTLMGRYFAIPAARPPLELEGGNFMTNGEGLCVATEWIVEQNHPKSASEVRRLAQEYFGCAQLLILERLEGEGTGHVDMFAKFLDRDTVLLGEYLRAEDPRNHAILERNAERLRAARLADGGPLEVVRIPMPRPTYPVYRSYTNSTLVNDTVVVPVYRRDRTREAQALAIYRRALPGHRIVTVDAEDAIELGGAVHCVTMGFVVEGRGPVRPTPPPAPPAPEPTPEPPPEDAYTARPDLPIRDGQRTTHALTVPDAGLVGRLTVELDIRHTYIGDLRITLRRGEREVELHRFTGGNTRDLQRAYTLDSFAGVERAGEWILSVEDHYQGDEGRLAAWGLRFE